MAFKRYSRKEPLVFLYVIVPYIAIMNLCLFGSCLFYSLTTLLKAFAITAIYFLVIYGIFGSVAVLVKNRNPGAGDLFRRIAIMLPIFYVLNAFAIKGAYLLYANIHVIDCPTHAVMYWWTVLYACIMSTLITFINEGMANWQNWKDSLAESEKLKSAYQRSKLLGLKGQINPHFLFNCFNTLSGLIQVDTDRAEEFLDEMTRVHRYLLRSDDEYLVSLQDEMKFARSYLALIKERFGNAIEVTTAIAPEALQKQLPPLTMQVILENVIYTNSLSRKDPLLLSINTDPSGNLVICHSLHEKIIVRDINLDEGLDNLLIKYRLLGTTEVKVTETPGRREIVLPLFDTHTVAA